MDVAQMTRTGVAMVVGLGLAGTALALAPTPAFAQNVAATDAGLASASLADGEAIKAIGMLEAQLEQYPGDPALLINLGIAHAQTGNDVEARARFDAALASRDVVELDTADGRTTNSRRLARQAIAMLDKGVFRPAPRQTDQLTLRN